MDRKMSENPHSPTSPPPENPRRPPRRRASPTGTHPPSPLIASPNLSADHIQSLESAFSGLAVSPEPRFHAKTLSFLTLDPFSPPEPALSLRDPHQARFWAHRQIDSAAANGPFGAHRRINAGPETMRFLGCSVPGLAGYHQHQPQDLYGDLSYLHGEEQFSRMLSNCYSIPPYVNQQSFVSTHSHLDKWKLQQITPEVLRGHVVSLAMDQMWSGALCLRVEEGLSEVEVEWVLPQVAGSLSDLMRNQFGSHFVHKFFVACNENQRTRILVSLTKSPFKLVTICLNSYGARAVQKLLEKLSTPHQISMVVSALSPGAISLANDPCGHHVIQHCISNFPGEYNKHLFNEIANNCFTIATNKSGCCVLPMCLEYAHGEAREHLINEIIANAAHLAEDPYGNYVVQHLVGSGMQDVKANLLRSLRGSFVSLSSNKYASNVVEKILRESSENHTAAIVMELLTSPNSSMLLLDPFGNFVIQSALSASKGHIRDALLNMIQANMSSMQSNLYGKKILDWIEKKKLRNVM